MEWKNRVTDRFVLWDAQSILTSAQFDYTSDLCCTEEISRGPGDTRVASLPKGALLKQEAQTGGSNAHSLPAHIPRAKAGITCV